MIVGLSGYAQVGKDTAAQVFERYGFNKYSFADPMREMALRINPIVDYDEFVEGVRYRDVLDVYGYEEAKKLYPEVRSFLQRLGTDAGREILGQDVWVNAGMERMNDQGGDYVIPDVRFPNEADAILKDGGTVIRITRPGHAAVNDHESETAMDHYEFDAYVDNWGTITSLHQRVWQAYLQTIGVL